MDVFTHALASVAVARVAIPRAPRTFWISAILAGTIADADQLSILAGPSTYLTWHHTSTHSIISGLAIAVFIAVVSSSLTRNFRRPTSGKPSSPQPPTFLRLSTALCSIALLHLALDACTPDPVAPFWPFNVRRLAADYLPLIDPYIIALFLAALLLPELLLLVSSEIGSKSEAPRGRIGAAIGLAAVLLYIAVRVALHSNTIGAIDSRTYRNESPRRSAAFPDSTSLFTWHGIVETASALHQFTISASASSLDPENMVVLFKPDPTPALDTARNSPAAKKFLAIAQFPKATVQKTQDGYEIRLRDLRYAAMNATCHEVIAKIQTDSIGKLLQDEVLWASDQDPR